MCTVIFSPHRKGYLLGMNRDEQLTRKIALPPECHHVTDRSMLVPSEPSGGTWIGLNNLGNCLALVNWYAVQARLSGQMVSRGQIIRNALPMLDEAQTEACLHELPLRQIRPFRLIGVFRNQRAVVEWRWNHQRLERLTHDWLPGIWISSGFDEAGAQMMRQHVFEMALKQPTAGTLPWLHHLHRSHEPLAGPYSICMHRSDAETVSFTEIRVTLKSATMRYRPGPPCRGSAAGYGRKLNL